MATTFADLDATDPDPVESVSVEPEAGLVPVVTRFLKERPQRFEDVTDNVVGQCPTSVRSECRSGSEVVQDDPIIPEVPTQQSEFDEKAAGVAIQTMAEEIAIDIPPMAEEVPEAQERPSEDSSVAVDQEVEEAVPRRRRRRG